MADEQVVPQLAPEERLAIRESQYQALRLREQARMFTDKASQIDQQTAAFINKFATDKQVDPKVYSFDIDTLLFHATV
jgi:hypothetical protein